MTKRFLIAAAVISVGASAVLAPTAWASPPAPTGAPISVGPVPTSVAFSPDGATAYVTDLGGGTVSVIDVATGTTTTIPVGSAPSSVAFIPNGTVAYVTNSGGHTVSVIDVATGTTSTPIPVGNQPNSVAFTPTGRAHMSQTTTATRPPSSVRQWRQPSRRALHLLRARLAPRVRIDSLLRGRPLRRSPYVRGRCQPD
jgi:YVTN family beta-propeller protein